MNMRAKHKIKWNIFITNDLFLKLKIVKNRCKCLTKLKIEWTLTIKSITSGKNMGIKV